jgi:uncharacterized protein (DUF697 family)
VTDWQVQHYVEVPDYEQLRAVARNTGLSLTPAERREISAALDAAVGIMERATPRKTTAIVTLAGKGGTRVASVTVSVVWAP